MIFVNKCKFEAKLKIKPLTKEQIILSIDRLTRFKPTEAKYTRVFKEIILHNLISPCFNKNNLENMHYEDIKNFAQEILNYSINKINDKNTKDYSINKKLFEYELSIFYNDEKVKSLLDNKIDYSSFIEFVTEDSPNNLKWLKALSQETSIKKEREIKSFKFPIEIVVLVEGATEEILLPEFAHLCDFDFDKNGVYLIPAGGKNQVVKLYYELSEILKLPIFVLFDKDGIENAREIQLKLRPKDKVYIIESGEFEDILSKDLVKRTLNYEFQNISETGADIIEEPGHRVKYLEDIFKNRGLHEFKKVEFAQALKANIIPANDLTFEIKFIIEQIKNLKQND